uniref:C-type lectin domain-containing protein n=1 Tax=Erpetoichthys calabaricus TaxID=27687 RepID=A0A8C4X2V3_ERPCA
IKNKDTTACLVLSHSLTADGFRLFVMAVHGSQEFNYYYVNEMTNWSNAQAYCRSNFTDLVTIADEEELKEILNNLTKENYSDAEIWIGLKDINKTNGTWSNGETFTYRKWNTEEPNNVNVSCGTMSQGKHEWQFLLCKTSGLLLNISFQTPSRKSFWTAQI